MPFLLKNAPAVFQRLKQNVFDGLNPDDGKPFIAAYLCNMLGFSATLQDHFTHLRKVINDWNLPTLSWRLRSAFSWVKKLSILVTSSPWKVSSLILALQKQSKSFQLLQMYMAYEHFSAWPHIIIYLSLDFQDCTSPYLTAKDVPFQWSLKCETAFTALKSKLVTPHVLAYAYFGEEFTLETDRCLNPRTWSCLISEAGWPKIPPGCLH